MPAIEWLKRIKDPAIREKALQNVNLYPLHPERIVYAFAWAILWAFHWDKTKEGHSFWDSHYSNPPELLPEPPAPIDREAAEAVLTEFEAYLNKNAGFAARARIDIHITDFLTEKYGK